MFPTPSCQRGSVMHRPTVMTEFRDAVLGLLLGAVSAQTVIVAVSWSLR